MTTRVRPRSGGFHRGSTSLVNSPRYPVPRTFPRQDSGGNVEDAKPARHSVHSIPIEDPLVAPRRVVRPVPANVENAARVEYVPPSSRHDDRKGKQRALVGPEYPSAMVTGSNVEEKTPEPLSGFELLYHKELGVVEESTVVGNCLADFTIIEELGRGAFGSVSKVVSKKDGNTYALKKIEGAHLKQKNQKEALGEVAILRRVRHPNIIRYYNSFMENSTLYIVMEYAPGGDLQKLVQRQRKVKKYIRESLLWKFMWELSQALKHLHEQKIIHRDMKSLNVFLGADQKIKIGDLGVSRLIGDDEMMAQTRVGTPLYLAPELIKRQPYDYKADIWSLGCLMYQLCALRPPFEGDNIYALAVEIMNQTPRVLPSHYSSDLCSVIFRMLEKKAKDRPYVNSVINSLPSTLAARFRNDGMDCPLAGSGPSVGSTGDAAERDVAVAEKRVYARPASASRAGMVQRQERPAASGHTRASSQVMQRPSSARMRRASDTPENNNAPFSAQNADASAPLQISVKQYAPSDHFSQTGQNRAASMPEQSKGRVSAHTERGTSRVSATAYNDATRPRSSRRSMI